MPKKYNLMLNNAYQWILKIISSKKFFYGIIILTIIQGIWYAIVYRPLLFDELYHVMATQFYVDHPNPFNIGVQEIKWDYLADMSRNVSYPFYYFLSLILRVVELFTESHMVQVISLRFVMIGFFVAGLTMYRKALLLAGFSSLVINIALLSMILLPNIAPIPGVVNYDNIIFFLFPAGLYFAIKIMKTNHINYVWYMALLLLIMVAILVKLTTVLVLFMPIIIFVVYDSWKKYHSKFMPLFMKSFKKSKNIVKISLVASILLCSGLLIERPVMNYINYKQLSPSCEKVLTKERCVSNYIVKRSVDASQSKDKNWKPYNPYQYGTIYWISSMLDTNLRTRIAPAPFPIIHLLYYTMAFVGSILILINLQSLLRKKYTRMIIIGFVVLVLSIFYSNYRAYINLEMAVAMNGRYLLPYMPIFGVLALASFSQLSNRLIKKIAVVIVLPVVLVSLTQGGGMITPIITHNTYWKENPFSEQLNSKAQKILAPVVLESSPFNLF